MIKKLAEQLQSSQKKQEEPKPVFFDLKHSGDEAELADLLARTVHIETIDTYETQLKELFVLQNPRLYIDPGQRDKEFIPYRDSHYGKQEAWQAGKWVYLSWRHVLVHILDDEGYQQVRCGRNRNLITVEEQRKYYNGTIGIGGLSVGNSCALGIVLTGGARNMKLADMDVLELSNLNRIRGSIAEITEPKVYMTARQIYELDPYAKLTLYSEGITEDNMEDFFSGLDIVIDEVDNLPVKLQLRKTAKKKKIPLLMATDNGDSGLLDVERYDKDGEIEPFHGRLSEQDIQNILAKKLSLPKIGKLISEKLVGLDITEEHMRDSLSEVGNSIPIWPQLGGAAMLNGVLIAAAVRRILNGQPVVDKRAVLSVWESLEAVK